MAFTKLDLFVNVLEADALENLARCVAQKMHAGVIGQAKLDARPEGS